MLLIPERGGLKVVVFFDVDLDVFSVRFGRLGIGLVHFFCGPEDFYRRNAAADTGDEKNSRHQICEQLRQRNNNHAETNQQQPDDEYCRCDVSRCLGDCICVVA